MKVIYVGYNQKKRNLLLDKEEDVILLVGSNWDDYHYKTTFKTYSKIGGESVELGGVQILIDNVMISDAYLDELVEKGWHGQFPIPKTDYISTPAAIFFYEQINGRLDIDRALSVAKVLRDASYLIRIEKDEAALALSKTSGFELSLQREVGAKKAFIDGWKLFKNTKISIGNQTFCFKSASDELLELPLAFTSDTPLPHDINVLIGPNGAGKSQVLRQIVDDWLKLGPKTKDDIGFTTRPNFSQVILVSYSPFEHFPVDTYDRQDQTDRKDRNVYRYFGLRGRKRVLNDSRRGSESIVVSEEFPKTNAAQSLIECLAFDQKFAAMSNWARRLETMENVLKTAFDFDHAAVAVRDIENLGILFNEYPFSKYNPMFGRKLFHSGGKRLETYIPISPELVDEIKTAELRKHVHDRSGVVFFKNGVPIHLSSGQQLFAYLVINILGAIRHNSLVLIDEPELFLHPALEIAFIQMLKSILISYACKALLATHSIITVREVPRDCVHVFEKTSEKIIVKHPPFETFGGDVQRISSYVFGDKSLSKPHEDWILQELKTYGSAKALISALGRHINEELIIQIQAMEAGKW